MEKGKGRKMKGREEGEDKEREEGALIEMMPSKLKS